MSESIRISAWEERQQEQTKGPFVWLILLLPMVFIEDSIFILC